MKEPHVEGPATHVGPESCAGTREGAGEALTGESAGRVLSREINTRRVPTLFLEAEGNTGAPLAAQGDPRPGAVVDPSHAWTLSARNTGDPVVARRGWCGGTRREGRRPTAPMHERGKSDGPMVPKKPPNKGALEASAEAVEGRGPAKGNADQQDAHRTQSRESTPSALDRVRENAMRATSEATNGPRSASTPGPEAGARCGSSARRDLRGGWPEHSIRSRHDHGRVERDERGPSLPQPP
jgi:hypothetical protein